MTTNVVRSLVTPEGIVTAHMDRSIQFRPHRGKSRRIAMPKGITVMLACTGPQDVLFRLIVGDRAGTVHTLTLPELKLLNSVVISPSAVTALEIHRPSDGWRLIAGCKNGEIHALGENIPSGSLKLFSIDSSVGLVRSSGELLTIHSGWSREVRHWNGDVAATPRRWFAPPSPPKRGQTRQLTLAKAAQA